LKNTFPDTRNLDSQVIYVQSKEGLWPLFLHTLPNCKEQVKSLTVVHMEVPCCPGLVHMTKQAIQLSGKDIPFKEVTVSIKGDLMLTS